MLVQFWKLLDSKNFSNSQIGLTYGLVQFWMSSQFFSSNYFQVGHREIIGLIALFELGVTFRHSSKR